ncbi:hypothetical protein RB195_023932 [Necator americanus]|uniref:Reverse transcriptase domain-containing protein n=1 Tax=Necator americanus TaxID=51031 RepID=A0ABR1EL65_NECAM
MLFAESSTKLQHVVNLVPKLAAAYGLRLRPDKCKQMWISSRPRTGIRVEDIIARYQHLTPPSKMVIENCLRLFGHVISRPADRLVERVLRSLSYSSWKRPPGRSGGSGVRRIWSSNEWIDSVQAVAEDREGWAELCSRTTRLCEDAGNSVRRCRHADQVK